MKVVWVRDFETITFNRPHTFFVLGVRGSGKSTLLEHIGEGYLEKGHSILDLFGSRDGENLAWLRSPYAKDKRIMLIHGDNVDVTSSFKTKNISKVSLGDFESNDIVISSSPLYSGIDDEFYQVNRIIDLLYRRLSWKHLIYMICRESANLYYSRLRISENQLSAKAGSVYLIREARHVGIAMGLDTLKHTSVDLDVRSVVDYLILKSQGVIGFPDSLRWLYGFFSPHVVRNMPPEFFCIVSRKGALGVGKFPELEWHKKERENILKSVGIKVEYGERVDYGKNKGTFKTVGDQEHVKIIDFYFEGKSMGTISHELKRSSATIHKHVKQHNEAIERLGYCMRCRRLRGSHEAEKAERMISTTA